MTAHVDQCTGVAAGPLSGLYNRAVAQQPITTASTESPSAQYSATTANSWRVMMCTSVMMYCHSVEVLASTRSPALKTGPLPASKLRTVRSTMSPSSDIQRRSKPTMNATTPTITAVTYAHHDRQSVE